MKRFVSVFLFSWFAIAGIYGQGLPDPSGATNVWPQLRILRTPPSASDPQTIIKRALAGSEYTVTPGDIYQLSLRLIETARSGSTQIAPSETVETYSVMVRGNYEIDVPYVGTINVRGMDFEGLQARVTEKTALALPHVRDISFSLQSPAQFDVGVFGEPGCPGIVTVSPLSRVSDVITLAQGVLAGASIRTIKLLRDGKSRTVDLFLYGFTGDGEQNPCVRPGDVLFIPRAGTTVVIGGAIMHSGTYELVAGETLGMLVDYAGGVSFGSHDVRAAIFRTNEDGSSTEIDVDTPQDLRIALINGDRIRIN